MSIEKIIMINKKWKLILMLSLVLSCSLYGFGQLLPIKTTRSISFSTDQGSYMNLDMSPDGKTLAFDLLGDLYLISATGGQAVQLTHGLAINSMPLWSPDGRKLAYISDADGTFHLCAIEVKTGDRTVFKNSAIGYNTAGLGTGIIWTAESNYLLSAGLYGLNTSLLSATVENLKPIRYSKDGKYLYGSADKKLYRLNLTSKEKIAISDTMDCAQLPGELSPNAKWWCFIEDSDTSRSLVAVNLLNNSKKMLVSEMLTDGRYKPQVPLPHFCYSPDSKGIFISYGGKIHRIDLEEGKNVIIPFRANVNADLGPLNNNRYRVNQTRLAIKYIRSANSSPDGKFLLFTAMEKIYEMDLSKPGSKPYQFSHQYLNQFHPTFSPDGKWVAYVSWCDTSGGALWYAPAKGGHPQRLSTEQGLYNSPSWSPDSRTLAFIHAPMISDFSLDYNDRANIESVSIETHLKKVLVKDISATNKISYSTDGKEINYMSGASFVKIKIGDENLSSIKPVIDTIAQGTFATGGWMISPDKKWAVYIYGEDLFLIPLTNAARVFVEEKAPFVTQKIRFAPGIDPYWDNRGHICWTFANHFYKSTVNRILVEANHELEKQQRSGKTEDGFVTAWVKPDVNIPIKIVVRPHYAEGNIALVNCRIITMHNNQVIENGSILISSGRIISVKSGKSVQKGYKIYNCYGKTIIPGIIDLHDHQPNRGDIHPQQLWSSLANLAYGITTARDPAASIYAFGYAEMLQTGQMLGPRLYTVGGIIRTFGGAVSRLDNQQDADAAISKRKVYNSSEIKSYALDSRIQRQWTQIACAKAKMNMTNEGGPPLQELQELKDGNTGIEHNPIWGDIYKDIITMYAKSGTYLTPTLQVSVIRDKDFDVKGGKRYFNKAYWSSANEKMKRFIADDTLPHDSHFGWEGLNDITNQSFNNAFDTTFLMLSRIDNSILTAGGLITLGSHGDNQGIGAHNELWALQMGGMTNMQALQCATINGAKALGFQRDIGSIEVGKIADLIILNSNPLDDIHNSRDIKYVMRDGILYDGNTLDELWPVFKKCPEWKMKTDKKSN